MHEVHLPDLNVTASTYASTSIQAANGYSLALETQLSRQVNHTPKTSYNNIQKRTRTLHQLAIRGHLG